MKKLFKAPIGVTTGGFDPTTPSVEIRETGMVSKHIEIGPGVKCSCCDRECNPLTAKKHRPKNATEFVVCQDCDKDLKDGR